LIQAKNQQLSGRDARNFDIGLKIEAETMGKNYGVVMDDDGVKDGSEIFFGFAEKILSSVYLYSVYLYTVSASGVRCIQRLPRLMVLASLQHIFKHSNCVTNVSRFSGNFKPLWVIDCGRSGKDSRRGELRRRPALQPVYV
jgi:hypothetical protein